MLCSCFETVLKFKILEVHSHQNGKNIHRMFYLQIPASWLHTHPQNFANIASVCPVFALSVFLLSDDMIKQRLVKIVSYLFQTVNCIQRFAIYISIRLRIAFILTSIFVCISWTLMTKKNRLVKKIILSSEKKEKTKNTYNHLLSRIRRGSVSCSCEFSSGRLVNSPAMTLTLSPSLLQQYEPIF